MEAVGAFLRAESFELGADGAVQSKRAQAEFGTQIASHHVDERGISAVRIVDREALKSGGSDARAKVAQHGYKRGAADGKSAGEADVFVAFAVADGGQGEDGSRGG